jgi:histidinol phosphatase-like enzyme (inositol monophosphatase family)
MPTPSSDQIAELLAFTDELADAARAVILPLFRANIAAENKLRSGFDPVTEADKGAERAIRALIEKRYPRHGILGEEYGLKPPQDGFTWVLDPVDGTRQFIAGLPLWGTLIGLTYEGATLIGAIDQAYIGERFRGWPGGADFKRDGGARMPIKTRACVSLREAILSTTDHNIFTGAEAGGFEHLRATAKLTRFGGDCYAYAMVAMGNMDLVAESGLAPWDVAALIPVIEGAGGLVSDWRGDAIGGGDWFVTPSGRTQILAVGDARVRDEALVSLKRAAN